jgi:lactate dehydrogenase-like 2-hydroxyacid dehydrogenase
LVPPFGIDLKNLQGLRTEVSMVSENDDLPRLDVAVTRALPMQVLELFRNRHDVWVNPNDSSLTPDELQQAARGADAMVVTAFDRLDADAIAQLPARLRILATYSVGVEHIDLDAAARRRIAVLSTPDVLSNSVAEMAILLMLGAARRAREGEALLYGKTWSGWTPTQLIGIELTGRRIGILGMGRIGRMIARRARGFDMNVHYHNRRRLEAQLEGDANYHPTLQGLLAVSDVLILAAPSTPQTQGLLNGARIEELPANDAILVNVARGDLIDDDALIGALRSGRIAGAGLDVFNNEPRLDARYLDLPNVFLQPHQGSSTLAARLTMASVLLAGIDAILAGSRPPNRLV